MRLPRPKSLNSLMLTGFALVSVPLLLAVVIAATKVRDLSEKSAALVRTGVETTHYTQQLFQQIASMERSAKLYQVFNDAGLLQVYRDSRERLLVTLVSIESAAGDPVRQTHVQALRGALRRIDAALLSRAPVPPDVLSDAVEAIAPMWEAAFQLSAATGEQVETGLSRLQAATAETQQYLFWQSAALILLTALLVTIFTLLLMRPIRQIDSAISQLGKGTFSKGIAVRGPTDLVDLGRQLEWLRMRLLDLAQERNRFLRHMSHELKTPLANIREGTDLLLDGAVGPIDDNQREVVAILRENALRLQQLIENLLSYSAWKSRASSVELSAFRLSSLVGTVIDSQRLAMAARNLTLDLHVEELNLVADRAKLKLVLENLLSNALKFTPRGGTIHLHAYPDGVTTVIDIADTGPGIAPDERDKVFDAFYSGKAPHGGPLKGTGIGLSVVREFVEAHGGTVEIVTGQFPGAHLRICLPAAARRDSAHAA